MFSRISSKIKGFALKVLDLEEYIPQHNSQYSLISSFKDLFKFDLRSNDLNELLAILKKKHLVDSITISNLNGSMLLSTNGVGIQEALSGTALFNYLQSEFPSSKLLLIKAQKWKMIIPFRDKIYIVNASCDLTFTELQKLASEIDLFIQIKK